MSVLRAAFISLLLLQVTWAIPASDSSAAVPTTTSKSVGVVFGSGSSLPDATSVTILPSGTGTPNQQQQQQRPGPPSIPPRLVPPAVQSVCDGDPGIPRSVRTLFQTGVTVTAGDCPPSNKTDSDSFALKARRRLSALEPRGGCNFSGQGSSTCAARGGGGFLGFARCGAQCDSACYDGFGGPDPNDCEAIFNSFRSRPDQILTLAHGKFLLYTFKSCGTGIQNQIEADSSICATNMIYDYQDWADVGSFLAQDCQATKQPQGARGGKCLASASDWYIQVYTNQ